SSAALRAGGIHRRQTRTTDLMHGASNRLLAAMLDGRADQPTADEVGGTHLRGSMDPPLIQLGGAAVRRETVRAVTNEDARYIVLQGRCADCARRGSADDAA